MARLGAILKFQKVPDKVLIIMLTCEDKKENNIQEQILQVDPLVWDSGVPPGRASTAQPVQICLKPGVAYPHKKQYPIKREALEGLQPIIEKFIIHGQLVPCQSPCNTPILPVRKPMGEYQLVQDLRLMNEAVLPLHPLVANAYTILTQVPHYTQWYTYLRLKRCLLFYPCPRFSVSVCI